MICSAEVLTAPCPFCGYNGPGFYQANTHAIGCPWRRIGGYEQREEHLRVTLPVIMKAYFKDRRRELMETVQPKETFEQVMDKVRTECGLDCTYVIDKDKE